MTLVAQLKVSNRSPCVVQAFFGQEPIYEMVAGGWLLQLMASRSAAARSSFDAHPQQISFRVVTVAIVLAQQACNRQQIKASYNASRPL
eukprot:s4468_g8.t1